MSVHGDCILVHMHLVTLRSAGLSVPKMQHSPSRSTNPEGLRMQRDLELRERLREDVRGHVVRRAVLDVDCLVGDGLANEMEPYVDVFGPRVIVIFCGEVKGCLVVAVESGRGRGGAEKGLSQSAEPDAFFCRVSCGNVFGLGGGKCDEFLLA